MNTQENIHNIIKTFEKLGKRSGTNRRFPLSNLVFSDGICYGEAKLVLTKEGHDAFKQHIESQYSDIRLEIGGLLFFLYYKGKSVHGYAAYSAWSAAMQVEMAENVPDEIKNLYHDLSRQRSLFIQSLDEVIALNKQIDKIEW